ncbi:hypothetical protein PRZ48_001014 [Zasmidium cellare]|uniref:Anaphase-promoting complex subunit 11 n=1 Tax=Zasmidium cellare TaxID=395010 RepID=A0ABR0F029_ZASCE|nr:hypothetical protein PRZ48_001014 [Zasmidium cellare]
MKVTIKGYNAVAEWKWALPPGCDDTCGICRVVFEGSCSKCKYPGDDCPIGKFILFTPASSSSILTNLFAVVGECKHVFHMHCITDWIRSEASQGRCPMCRQVFKEKTAHSNVTTHNGNGGGGGPAAAGAAAGGTRASTSTASAR